MKPHVVKSYLNTSKELISNYMEECNIKFIPLNLYLKAFYKKNSKYGKRDRNAISDLVFAFFRLGYTLPAKNIEQRILAGSYLCNHTNEGIYGYLSDAEIGGLAYEPDLNKRIETASKYFQGFNKENIFPFDVELSAGIEKHQYFEALLSKPATFIRVLEKNKLNVLAQLKDEGIEYQEPEDHPNALKILSAKNLQDLSAWKKGYFEIQDLSSQQIGNHFEPVKGDKWWDVCAASGGKSLLLLSKERDVFILASDIRKNILQNYTERIKRLNFLNFETRVINASEHVNMDQMFDGIICDVPCTGSGTWHRTPENLFFFNENSLKEFNHIQKQILNNTPQFLKPGKNLIYITCSVFKAENEDVSSTSELSLINNGSINNFSLGADAMYFTKFTKA